MSELRALMLARAKQPAKVQLLLGEENIVNHLGDKSNNFRLPVVKQRGGDPKNKKRQSNERPGGPASRVPERDPANRNKSRQYSEPPSHEKDERYQAKLQRHHSRNRTRVPSIKNHKPVVQRSQSRDRERPSKNKHILEKERGVTVKVKEFKKNNHDYPDRRALGGKTGTSSASTATPSRRSYPEDDRYPRNPSTSSPEQRNERFMERGGKKAMEREREFDESSIATHHKNYGKVPSYINKYRSEVEEKIREEQTKKDEIISPKGFRRVSEKEKQNTINTLQEEKKEYEEELTRRQPFRTETLGQKNAERELHSNLKRVEEGLRLFSKDIVFVPEECEPISPRPKKEKQELHHPHLSYEDNFFNCPPPLSSHKSSPDFRRENDFDGSPSHRNESLKYNDRNDNILSHHNAPSYNNDVPHSRNKPSYPQSQHVRDRLPDEPSYIVDPPWHTDKVPPTYQRQENRYHQSTTTPSSQYPEPSHSTDHDDARLITSPQNLHRLHNHGTFAEETWGARGTHSHQKGSGKGLVGKDGLKKYPGARNAVAEESHRRTKEKENSHRGRNGGGSHGHRQSPSNTRHEPEPAHYAGKVDPPNRRPGRHGGFSDEMWGRGKDGLSPPNSSRRPGPARNATCASPDNPLVPLTIHPKPKKDPLHLGFQKAPPMYPPDTEDYPWVPPSKFNPGSPPLKSALSTRHSGDGSPGKNVVFGSQKIHPIPLRNIAPQESNRSPDKNSNFWVSEGQSTHDRHNSNRPTGHHDPWDTKSKQHKAGGAHQSPCDHPPGDDSAMRDMNMWSARSANNQQKGQRDDSRDNHRSSAKESDKDRLHQSPYQHHSEKRSDSSQFQGQNKSRNPNDSKYHQSPHHQDHLEDWVGDRSESRCDPRDRNRIAQKNLHNLQIPMSSHQPEPLKGLFPKGKRDHPPFHKESTDHQSKNDNWAWNTSDHPSHHLVEDRGVPKKKDREHQYDQKDDRENNSRRHNNKSSEYRIPSAEATRYSQEAKERGRSITPRSKDYTLLPFSSRERSGVSPPSRRSRSSHSPDSDYTREVSGPAYDRPNVARVHGVLYTSRAHGRGAQDWETTNRQYGVHHKYE